MNMSPKKNVGVQEAMYLEMFAKRDHHFAKHYIFESWEESRRLTDFIRLYVSEVAQIVRPCSIGIKGFLIRFVQAFHPLLRPRVHVLEVCCRKSNCFCDCLGKHIRRSTLERPKNSSIEEHAGLEGNEQDVLRCRMSCARKKRVTCSPAPLSSF